MQRDYGQDDDCEATDPGNRLRAELSKVNSPLGESRALSELLYTASERGIIDFSIELKDAETIYRIFKLAKSIDAGELELKDFRM